MYTVEDIESLMERWAPESLCSEGDNVGLLVGRKSAEVRGILVAFEVTSDIIDEAIDTGSNLIVCHHPLIFYPPLKRITDDDYVESLVLRLIENRISLYAAHTNLDWAEEGVTQTLAEKLGIDIIDRLKGNEGIYGDITPETLLSFTNKVKTRLHCPHLKFVGAPDKTVSRVGVVSGGGGDYIKYALDVNCDVFVSADFKYHQAHMAYENDIAIVDAGHFETENIIVEKIFNYLNDNTNGVHLYQSKRNQSFYNYI